MANKHLYLETIDSIRSNYSSQIKSFCSLEGKKPQIASGSLISFNLIEELHLDNKKMYENAHTRILGALLQYNDNQFLNSFLERFCKGIYYQKKYNVVRVERQYKKTDNGWIAVETSEQKEGSTLCRPDCMIWKKNHYVVIIENKINGASETNHQVDHYIEAVLADDDIFSTKDDIIKKIWVVYLGGDTSEMPSKNSLSNKYDKNDKYFIVGKDESRSPGKHLSVISYKEDIIPWLQEEVLPQCPVGMMGLTGGLMVYIDYLKKRFEDNTSEEIKFYDSDKVIELFKSIDNNTILPFFWKKYNDIGDFVFNEAFSKEKDLSFFKALRHYYLNHHFRFNEPSRNETWTIRTTGSFVHIWKNAWERIQKKTHATCDLYFELFPYQIDEYLKNPISSKRAITCGLRYKGKDSLLESIINHRIEELGINLDGYVFDKKSQKNSKTLVLSQEAAEFFDSFVEDKTISRICELIDVAIKEHMSHE